jgi:hypothetical protein
MRRLLIASLSLGIAGSTFGQADSLVERQKIDTALAEQKADADVLEAIRQAEQLAATSKAKAVERLKNQITAIDLSATLSSTKRQALIAVLTNKIGDFEGRATIVLPPGMEAKSKADARVAMEKAKAEVDEVRKGLKKADDAMAAGRSAEAAKAIGELLLKYPDNPALQSLRGSNLTRNNLASWNKIQDEYAQAWVADQQNIMASAIPTTDDIKFPNAAKWKQITELRRDMNKIKLSEKEKAILESLSTVVLVSAKNRPFQEALQEFSNQIKQEIFLDTKSLEDAGIDLNRNVNFSGNVSARTALRAFLQPQNLTFVVKDEMIQIVTLEKAERDMLTTRSYDVSDIIDTGGPFSNAVQWGPNMAYQQTVQNADSIVNLIRESIDPRCWKDKGGFCSITFHLPTKSIVVRASTEVHAQLGGAVYGKK